jgi:DNA-binding NarL/FixJ family response regulator
LSDKEVASLLYKSYWTVKTQKKAIYQKLGISKDTELLWYMICERMGVEFSIKELREKGIELLTR